MTRASANGADELSGARLRALRKQAGISQVAAAAAIGVNQATMSRYENGRALPGSERLRALLIAYRIQGPAAERLIARAEALETEHVDSRVVLQDGGAHHFQLRVRQAEQAATLICSYQPVTVLGVLQTRAFADAVFTPDENLTAADAAASVAERMARWEVLAQPHRRWRLIQTEQALRWVVRDYALMAEQIDQIIVASNLPNVELGLIPLDTRAPAPAPLTGFHIYDDRQVTVGTDTGTALLSAPGRVRAYADRFTALQTLAVFGEDARSRLAVLAEDYRSR